MSKNELKTQQICLDKTKSESQKVVIINKSKKSVQKLRG